MAVAKVDMANVALRMIGASRITSFSQGNSNANAVNDLYEEVRRKLLRKHNWKFASKRLKLAQSANTPAYEYDYFYPYPSDWLKTISVHDNDAGAGVIDYKAESVAGIAGIVTSETNIYMKYIYDVQDPNQMAADFRFALETALAMDLSIPLTGSKETRNSMKGEHSQAIMAARSNDSIESIANPRPRGSWANSRSGWR